MRRIALMSAASAGLFAAGCMTIGPVAGPALATAGFSYSAGRASQDFAHPPAAIQSAVVAAMDDLRMHSVRLTHDDGLLSYDATTADDRRVRVTIRPNQAVARVAVRIGWFGDEPLSRALMDRIGIRLGTLPPSAVPVDPPSVPEGNPYFSRQAIPDSTMLREQAEAPYRDSLVPTP